MLSSYLLLRSNQLCFVFSLFGLKCMLNRLSHKILFLSKLLCYSDITTVVPSVFTLEEPLVSRSHAFSHYKRRQKILSRSFTPYTSSHRRSHRKDVLELSLHLRNGKVARTYWEKFKVSLRDIQVYCVIFAMVRLIACPNASRKRLL